MSLVGTLRQSPRCRDMSGVGVARKLPDDVQNDAIGPEQTFGPSPGPVVPRVLAVIKLTEYYDNAIARRKD